MSDAVSTGKAKARGSRSAGAPPAAARTPAEKRPRPSRTRRQGRPADGDSDATRRRIMEAAQLCFAEHGYRETSNRTIAEVANLTTGTIYHYFHSKRDLFLSIHRETQEDIQRRFQPILESEMTLSQSMSAFLRLSLQLYIERPHYHKFNAVVRTEALRNPEIAEARVDREWRKLYREFAERAVRNGEIDRKDMRALQAVLGAIILGTTQHAMEATLADHKECLRGIDLLFHGELVHPPKR